MSGCTLNFIPCLTAIWQSVPRRNQIGHIKHVWYLFVVSGDLHPSWVGLWQCVPVTNLTATPHLMENQWRNVVKSCDSCRNAKWRPPSGEKKKLCRCREQLTYDLTVTWPNWSQQHATQPRRGVRFSCIPLESGQCSMHLSELNQSMIE